MKLKKQFKDWRKLSKHEKREILTYCESYGQEHKNHMLALKFAKKALRHIKKDAEGDCGFWGERYCGCYCETCLALGWCTYDPANCPLEIAKALVRSLNFERVEVEQ